MRQFIIILCLILLLIPLCTKFTFAEDGDFWREKSLERQGWEIVSKNSSHIIYKSQYGNLWTKCHSCGKLIKVKASYKCIIDRRKIRNGPILVSPNGNFLVYEELYYCERCYQGDWNCEKCN